MTLSPPSSSSGARATTHGDAPCQTHDGRSGQGPGGGPPPLDSIPSEIAPNLPQKAGDSSGRGGRGRGGARAPAARPARLTADEYRAQTARALELLGAPHRAAALRRCGRVAVVHTCDTCGDPLGAVVRPLSCGLRACPDCARLLAADRVRALGAGVDGVPGGCLLCKVGLLVLWGNDGILRGSGLDEDRRCLIPHGDLLHLMDGCQGGVFRWGVDCPRPVQHQHTR